MSNYVLSMDPPADCSPEDVERAVQYYVSLPLADVERKLEVNRLAVIATAASTVLTHEKAMEVLRQLKAVGDHLREAVTRKTQ